MKIQHLAVHHFRSIADAGLHNISDFNVLIGRNNSGKSNMLSCLDTFFSCLRPGDIIIERPRVGAHIDFYARDISCPIDITVVFSLSLVERDELLHDIVSEVPEMRHAIDGLDPSYLLSVTIRILASSEPTSENCVVYVSRITLSSAHAIFSENPSERRIILDVNTDAAHELHAQRETSRRLRQKRSAFQRLLDRVDQEDWQRFKNVLRESSGSSIARHFMLREFIDYSSDFSQLAQDMVTNSSSFEELQNNISSEINSLGAEAEKIDNKPLANKIATITGEVTRVPSYVRRLLQRIASIKVLHLRERRKEIGAEEAEKLLKLKVSRGGPEVLRSIQEIVRSLLGVNVDAFAANASPRPTARTPGAELDVDDFLVEANGAGIREALRIVLDFEFEHPKVLLIEEPEIHLHPALETSMLRYLRRVSSMCQVFITTHSTNFLDSSDIRNVYMISKNSATRAKLLTLQDAEEQLPRELGIRLSSLFMFDRLVFVEGDSDENIFREMAACIGANLANANAGFIRMGGARNFAHFASDATMSFLTKRQVRCWFIVDRDERDDDDVRRLKKMLGDNASLSVLGKREVESYLLVPRVIERYIRGRLEQHGSPAEFEGITEESIRVGLEQCAEELRDVAIYRRVVKKLCGPNFSGLGAVAALADGGIDAVGADFAERIQRLSDANARLPGVVEEVRSEVERVWEVERLDIVPGEELLQSLFERYKLRYRKDRDGPGLAALMQPRDVHQDLRTVIEDIARAA